MSVHLPVQPPVRRPLRPRGEPHPRPLRVLFLLLATLAILVAGIALGVGPAPSSASPPLAPRISGSVITRVTGDAAYGFTIRHLSGRVDHPETRSEALAECLGYRRLRLRARCRGHLNTWYADLAKLEQTIDYYRGLDS